MSSLIFCTGPLTILGSLNDGLGNGADQLFLKSTLDGFAAIAMTQQVGRDAEVTDDGTELSLQTTRSPIRIDGERMTSGRAAPKLGQHNDTVWPEFLGVQPASPVA